MVLLINLDTNECTEMVDNCHDDASCYDTEGSFMCECNTGFSGDGINCTGITGLSLHLGSIKCILICGIHYVLVRYV